MATRRTTTTSRTTSSTGTQSSRGRKPTTASTARALAPAIMTAALIGGTALTTLKAPMPTPPTAAPRVAVVQKGTFTPVCTLPFNGVRNPAADDHCGIEGDGTDIADQLEATAKNNFCAPTAIRKMLLTRNCSTYSSRAPIFPRSLTTAKKPQTLEKAITSPM